MDFNSKMGFGEQDYQLLKETTSGITGKVNKIADDVAAKLPEVNFGPVSFTIEKNVPFYGYVAGLIRESSIEDILGGGTNLSLNTVSIQNPIDYGNYPNYYPELAPILWDGTKGSLVTHSLGYNVEFTLQDDTQPGILTMGSTNMYTIKTNLKG